jgi:gluconokinase
LKGDAALLSQRLARRRAHFMPPSLLASQFHDLEAPTIEEGAIVIGAGQPVEAQVESIVRLLAA